MSALILLAGFVFPAGAAVGLNQPAAAGYLGVTLAVERDRPTIDSVVENSPAAKAGLKSGDVITKVDGKDMGTVAEFTSAMLKRKAGDELTLTLTRGTDTVEVKAKLVARPKLKK